MHIILLACCTAKYIWLSACSYSLPPYSQDTSLSLPLDTVVFSGQTALLVVLHAACYTRSGTYQGLIYLTRVCWLITDWYIPLGRADRPWCLRRTWKQNYTERCFNFFFLNLGPFRIIREITEKEDFLYTVYCLPFRSLTKKCHKGSLSWKHLALLPQCGWKASAKNCL